MSKRTRTTQKARIASTADDFLKDEGTYEATQAVAIKRVLTSALGQRTAAALYQRLHIALSAQLS